MIPEFKIEPAKFLLDETRYEIDPASLKRGLNCFDDLIVWLDDEECRVYNRICDHNGGKLMVTSSGETVCPLHGWTFDPASGKYLNAQVQKTPLKTIPRADIGETLAVTVEKKRRELEPFKEQQQVRVRFLNHACLVFETPHLKFAIDPWIVGPAFCRGWWLANPSPADSFDELNSCDFIYISHNHPDHLHPESLARIDKNLPIFTGAFATGSTESYLKELGFVWITTMGFEDTYHLPGREFCVSALKSGDFRDDSGLLIQAGAFTAMLTVDSNYFDFYRFPKGTTLLATSFAGGASGFPLCFDVLSEESKNAINARNRNALRATNQKMIELSKARYYMPYAGMFTEKAERDSYIRTSNGKNAISDFAPVCEKTGSELLDLSQHETFFFSGDRLERKEAPSPSRLDEISPAAYIAAAKAQYESLDVEAIRAYFEGSNYRGDLALYVTLCHDDFHAIEDIHHHIIFSATSAPRPSTVGTLPDLQEEFERTGVNVLHVKIRREAFAEVVTEGLPWEDFSIGFQCRIDRFPNVYNAEFWYHFTNVYVKQAVTQALAHPVAESPLLRQAR